MSTAVVANWSRYLTKTLRFVSGRRWSGFYIWLSTKTLRHAPHREYGILNVFFVSVERFKLSYVGLLFSEALIFSIQLGPPRRLYWQHLDRIILDASPRQGISLFKPIIFLLLIIRDRKRGVTRGSRVKGATFGKFRPTD